MWKSRNDVVFKMKFIIQSEQLFVPRKIWLNGKPEKRFDFELICGSFISWAKPPKGFIKINFGGSKSPSSAGEFIIQSWNGRFLQVETFNMEVASVLVTKATIMHNKVCAAAQGEYHSVVLESDNQVRIQTLKGKVHCDSPILNHI